MCLTTIRGPDFFPIVRFFRLALAMTNENLTQHHRYPWMFHRDQSFLHSSISFMKTSFWYVKIERERRAIAPCTASQSWPALVSSHGQMPILRTIESNVCFSAEVMCALRRHAQTLFPSQSSRFRRRARVLKTINKYRNYWIIEGIKSRKKNRVMIGFL